MNSLVLLPATGLDHKTQYYINGKEYDIDEYISILDYNDLFQCRTCKNILHVKLNRDQPNAKFDIIWDETEFHKRIKVVTRTPSIYKSEKWDESIPLNIRKDLAEANTAFSMYLFNASTLLIRRSLEQTAKDKNAVGKNLSQKIKDLLKNDHSLFSLADNIRILGNLAAHDANPSEIREEDAKDLIVFADHFVKAMYVMPAKVDEMRKRR